MEIQFNEDEVFKTRMRLGWKVAGVKLDSVANDLEITRGHLNQILYHKRESPRVWSHIITLLGYDPRIEAGPNLKAFCSAIANPGQNDATSG